MKKDNNFHINELRFLRVSDSQTLLKILDGTNIAAVSTDYDVLTANMDKGGYEFVEWSSVSWLILYHSFI